MILGNDIIVRQKSGQLGSLPGMPSPPIIVRVFVSSTWLDLQAEQRAVETALQRMRETKFVGMEHFGSRNEEPRQASLNEVDYCQGYIGIFAGRYGSGITEEEYRRARERKIPCFIYFKDEGTIPRKDQEKDPGKSVRLANLKAELRTNHTGSSFLSPDDLLAKVTADLHRWLFDEYLAPQLEQAVNSANQSTIAGLTEATIDKEALRQALSGRGITVGTDITESLLVLGNQNVINVLVQGVSKLPTDYTHRIQQFLIEYLGTPEHPVPFGGRAADIAYLDEWLADSQAPPYLLLASPAGRGKSALLARWSNHLLAKGEVTKRSCVKRCR